jgi:hypothetical protein
LGEGVQTDLHHVVAVQVQAQPQHLVAEGLVDQSAPRFGEGRHLVQHGLKSASAVLVQSDGHKARFNLLEYLVNLVGECSLDELLAQVVGEGVHHQLLELLSQGVEQLLLELRACLGGLLVHSLLNLPAPILVFG